MPYRRSTQFLAAAATSTTGAAPPSNRRSSHHGPRTRSRAASCSTLGTVTDTISPRCSNRARWRASRASVLTRSPDARCNFDGAATTQSTAPRSGTEPERTRSGQPHRPPSPGQATIGSIPGSLHASALTGARTVPRSAYPSRTPPPIVRAHPTRHSYAEDSLGPPTSCGSSGQDLWLYRPGPTS